MPKRHKRESSELLRMIRLVKRSKEVAEEPAEIYVTYKNTEITDKTIKNAIPPSRQRREYSKMIHEAKRTPEAYQSEWLERVSFRGVFLRQGSPHCYITGKNFWKNFWKEYETPYKRSPRV